MEKTVDNCAHIILSIYSSNLDNENLKEVEVYFGTEIFDISHKLIKGSRVYEIITE